jgi:signal transduction histidine kinase
MGMKEMSRPTLLKWGIVLFLAIPHLVTLSLLGDRYGGTLGILPVAAAGWFFGIPAGLVTALFLLVHLGITTKLHQLPWTDIFASDFLIGAAVLALVGGIFGWGRALYDRHSSRDVELNKRLQEADAISRISMALSEAQRIGLANILQLIVDSAKELIPAAEQAVIHVPDEEKQYLIAKAVSGFRETSEGKLQMRFGEGVAGQAIISGETINITDITTDTRFLKPDTLPKFRSLMVTPILSGEQKLGTISVQSKEPNAFSKGEQELLSTLGVQAAIAIENANLIESTQQALRETNALYRINQGLVALNADELLEDAVELLRTNFGYYHVQVFVIEPNTGDFHLRAASGEVGKRLKAQQFRMRAGSGIVGHAAETLAPFFTNNVEEVVFFTRNPHLPETRSELAVPVKIGSQLFGILDIQQAPPKIFSPRDLQLVSAVADQLAIALQKAELYENLQKSLQQEKAIRDQLVQNERLAIMGRLLASVSHELNNPLQAIQNALFLLKEEQGFSAQGRQDLDIVLAESERMAGMIERLRTTYRPTQAEDFKPTQLNSLIEDVRALLATHLKKNRITFEFHPEPHLPIVPALSDQIRQVVLNLFINAVEAMSASGGTLKVQTKFLKDANEILLVVSDTGAGIADSVLPHIFEPFITNTPGGTGLGLTISRDIVIKHHGRVHAENNPQGGAVFQVWLPTKHRQPE